MGLLSRLREDDGGDSRLVDAGFASFGRLLIDEVEKRGRRARGTQIAVAVDASGSLPAVDIDVATMYAICQRETHGSFYATLQACLDEVLAGRPLPLPGSATGPSEEIVLGLFADGTTAAGGRLRGRTVLPGVIALPAVSRDGHAVPLPAEVFVALDTDEDGLYATAQRSSSEMTGVERRFHEGITVLHGAGASTQALWPENHADPSEHGVLLAIPVTDLAAIYPIAEQGVADAIRVLVEIAVRAQREEQSAVSLSLYWRRGETCEEQRVTLIDGAAHFEPGEGLKALVNGLERAA